MCRCLACCRRRRRRHRCVARCRRRCHRHPRHHPQGSSSLWPVPKERQTPPVAVFLFAPRWDRRSRARRRTTPLCAGHPQNRCARSRSWAGVHGTAPRRACPAPAARRTASKRHAKRGFQTPWRKRGLERLAAAAFPQSLLRWRRSEMGETAEKKHLHHQKSTCFPYESKLPTSKSS